MGSKLNLVSSGGGPDLPLRRRRILDYTVRIGTIHENLSTIQPLASILLEPCEGGGEPGGDLVGRRAAGLHQRGQFLDGRVVGYE